MSFELPYIHKDKIKDRLERARENERKRATEEHNKERKELLDRLNQDHSFDLQEKEAEIATLNNRLSKLAKRNMEIEEVYDETVRMIKKNRRIAIDLAYQVQHLLKEQAYTLQPFLEMQESIENLEGDMVSHHEKNRAILMAPQEE